MSNGVTNGAAKHPAETSAGAAGAIAALVVYFVKIEDPAIVVPLITAIGFVPTVVTWLAGLFHRDKGPAA